MTIYKAALIGCGKIASQFSEDPKVKGVYTHAEAYTTCTQTKLIAACDINEMYADACAKQWQIPHYYTSIDAMFKAEQPDIVSICTPDATHADILEQVLDIPGIKGILIEKPLALEVSRAARLIAVAESKQIALLVNYNRRYAKGHQKIKTFIEKGDLGVIGKVSGYYTKGIMHNGTHWLDLARWLVGDIQTLQGFADHCQSEPDPTLDAWLHFKNNAIGYLHGLHRSQYSLFEMDVLGTNGRIRISQSGFEIEYFTIKESEYFTGFKSLQKYSHEHDSVSDTVLTVVYDLIYAIEHQTKPLSSAQDGLQALSLAAALITSAQTGKKIQIG